MNNLRNKLWQLSISHWMSTTKIYNVFRHIIKRCNNKWNAAYKNYWFRWIKCLRKNFEDFYKDMYPTYKEWLQIDRIDNNGNYCKENCRRITSKENNNNRRNNHLIQYHWEIKTLQQWSDIIWISWSVIATRLKRWWSIEDSFETPVWKSKKVLKSSY